MTTRAEHRAPSAGPPPPPPALGLLPAAEPIRFVTDDGTPAPAEQQGRYAHARPSVDLLRRAYRSMVVGRRFDAQATALTKQGRLAVYPSSRGQEACQVGAVLALRSTDWLFPTYRDTMALISRDIDAVEALTLLRGNWHCGYDPRTTRTAPQCTPLATHAAHAVGYAYAARRKGEDTVALVMIGDGGTSEGDFHEALNFAALFSAPVVFLVQNNGYAISVPLSQQTAAPSLAHKGVGYGVRSEQVDGNDALAVLAVLSDAVESARSGAGPVLVEAHTYRIEPHTNADDDSRYRDHDEVEDWKRRDPIDRLAAYLRSTGDLTDDDATAAAEQGERLVTDLRSRMATDPVTDPSELFEHVYAERTPQLAEQAGWLAEELSHGGAH